MVNLDFLMSLVNINSETKNIDGVNEIQKRIAKELVLLGFEINFLSNNQDKTGELLLASKKGITNKAITLVCHADTVFDEINSKNFSIDFNTGRVYGSGVGDNKGGIALILGAMKNFLEKNQNHHYTLNIVCSPNEERGSIGFQEKFKQIGLTSDYIFGFEPAMSDGNIINERSGNRWYKLNIKGLNGHAGRWNVPSINAAHIGAEIVHTLEKLNCFESKRRVNVGSIKSDTSKFNIVCGELEILLDTRFKTQECLSLINETIIETLQKTLRTDFLKDRWSEYSYTIEDDCPAFARNSLTCSFQERYLDLIEKNEGRRFEATYSGGAADINYFFHEKAVCLDGLGPIGHQMHSLNESIEIGSFYTRMKTFEEILIYLNSYYLPGEFGHEFNCRKDHTFTSF